MLLEVNIMNFLKINNQEYILDQKKLIHLLELVRISKMSHHKVIVSRVQVSKVNNLKYL